MNAAATLPRTRERLRAMAVGVGVELTRKSAARQAVSDRIGYIVAAAIGAGVFSRWGWSGLKALVALYVLSAFLAYRKYKQIEAEHRK
jgi:hypothetical protein